MLRRTWICCLLLFTASACSSPARPQLIVAEHLLTGPPDLSTDQLVFHFAAGDQARLLARTQPYRDFHGQISRYNLQILAQFGYVLGDYREDDQTFSNISIGGKQLASNVVFMGPVSMNASRTDFISRVDLPDGTYAFSRSGIEMLPSLAGRQPWSYLGDQLLSTQISGFPPGLSHLRVYLDDRLAYETTFHDVSTYGSFVGPWTYGRHWALVLLDAAPVNGGWEPRSRLIQDGHDLNQANGYQQSFQFAVLDGRPFYFFARYGVINMSFDGRARTVNYAEIPHYGCCTASLLNPGVSMNAIWFFARRGAEWYYVEAYVPASPSS